jgi:cation diffusion facilitator family transporter
VLFYLFGGKERQGRALQLINLFLSGGINMDKCGHHHHHHASQAAEELSAGENAIAMRISHTSIAVNLLLSLFKLVAGVIGRSGAMISDAVHSASDVFSTIVVIVGVKLSQQASDSEHQYGHERLECVASIILADMLLITGCGIGYKGIRDIMTGATGSAVVPGKLALIAAVVSIAVKEWMYWFTRAGAKKINSGALMADAWHHRSDALSSVGAFVGILGARLGFPILDPVASVVICLFIVKAAYDIFMDAVDKMVDKSCDEETVARLHSVCEAQQGVIGVDSLKTRLFGSRIYVDVEIGADGSRSLDEAHAVAVEVHDAIEREFPLCKHCMVHVNPKSVE